MSKNFTLQALKMLYSNNSNNIDTIINDTEIDYNFCKIYYETNDVETIKKLSNNNVKNMNDLNTQIGQNFNLASYSKFITHIKNDILLKKHYLESLQKKINHEQILHIILIKNTNFPLESFISDFNNLSIQISLVTSAKDDTTHYNVIKYICQPDTHTEVVNKIIMNNKSNFFMIIHDNYCFEYNFVNRILKDLFELFNTNGLLLINDKLNNTKSQKTNFFKQNPKTIIKFDNSDNYDNSHIFIINNNIKQQFNYSTSDVGILLYYYQILKNKESYLCTTDYKFKLVNDKNTNIFKDIANLVNIYLSNIENTTLIDYDKNKQISTVQNIDDILSLNSNIETVNINVNNTNNTNNYFDEIFSKSEKDIQKENKISITEQLILKTITEQEPVKQEIQEKQEKQEPDINTYIVNSISNINNTSTIFEDYCDEKTNIINQLNNQLLKNEQIRKESINKINNILNQPLIEHLKEQINHQNSQQLKQIINNKLLDNTEYKFNINNINVDKVNAKKMNNIEIDFLLKEDKDIMNI